MSKIFIPKEVREDERRVAATPETVKKFVAAGYQVTVETGAGDLSFFGDESYKSAGAEIVTDLNAGYAAADLVLKVQPPRMHPQQNKHEVELLKEGCMLAASFTPQSELDMVKLLMDRKISSFSMNLIPRITIAQKMDTLSSQANIAGYKAVLLAANALPKYFPLLMTAAGTITPAKVVILGAGVAGLQAIATARRLGALVEAFDVRAAVKEQVESLGAKFIEVPSDEDQEDAGGYAKEQSEDFLRRQREEIHSRLSQANIAITTALIPGRPAPRLIEPRTVEAMKPGSVIVDLAVEMGGNCELSEAGKTVVKHGVTIIGETNLPALMSEDASRVYARNMLNFVTHMTKDGQFQIDEAEAITDGSLLTHQGVLRHQPTKDILEKGA